MFPEITFRVSGVVPPTVVLETAYARPMPDPFGSAAVPAAFVPMKLPCTKCPLPPSPPDAP